MLRTCATNKSCTPSEFKKSLPVTANCSTSLMSLIPPQMPNIWFTTQTLFINLFGRRSSKMWIPHSDFSSTTQGWSHQNTCFFDQLTRISLGCSPSLWKVLSFDQNQALFDYTFVLHDSILKTWSERWNMAWFVVAKCLQTPCKNLPSQVCCGHGARRNRMHSQGATMPLNFFAALSSA